MFSITQHSLDLTRKISEGISDQTFHHHFHILYDIARSFPDELELNYLEIGCFAGASACLMAQRPKTNIYSIDLGDPIPKEVVFENIQKFNPHDNRFEYIQGNSHSTETKSYVKNLGIQFDILFIDGDHSFNGVIKDFMMYYPLVKTGGYLVFDDYGDIRFSPEVKTAVDYILKNYWGFQIFGAFGKEFGARGECPSLSADPYDRDSNEFVIQKKI